MISIPSKQKLLTEIGKVKAILRLFDIVSDITSAGGDYNFYTKPSDGIPITDMTLDFQQWKNSIDFLISGGEPPTEAIDTFNEIVAFLDSIEDTTLSGIISAFANKNEAVLSEQVRNVVVCTQAQYDALTTKDANTEYNIIENNA